MNAPFETKAVVTVSEMARMVGLSRARFYQLVEAGVFPPPAYSVSTHRPLYSEQLQRDCLEVRRRNRGINGQAVLFYSKASHPKGRVGPASQGRQKPNVDCSYDDLLVGVQKLGLVAATRNQVRAAVQRLFPDGLEKLSHGQAIRAVFLDLRQSRAGHENNGP
jgi:hypothetical protein